MNVDLVLQFVERRTFAHEQAVHARRSLDQRFMEACAFGRGEVGNHEFGIESSDQPKRIAERARLEHAVAIVPQEQTADKPGAFIADKKDGGTKWVLHATPNLPTRRPNATAQIPQVHAGPRITESEVTPAE